MKFKLLPIILATMMMVGCNKAPTPLPEPEPEKIVQVIDFSTTEGSGEHDAESLMTFMEGKLVQGVENVSKIYKSTGSSGAHPNENGIIKTGTAKANGTFKIKLKKVISKIAISCHDFYAKSEQYPENSNWLKINDVQKIAPYNEAGTAENLEWTLEQVSEINFEATRTYIGKITLYE